MENSSFEEFLAHLGSPQEITENEFQYYKSKLLNDTKLFTLAKVYFSTNKNTVDKKFLDVYSNFFSETTIPIFNSPNLDEIFHLEEDNFDETIIPKKSNKVTSKTNLLSLYLNKSITEYRDKLERSIKKLCINKIFNSLTLKKLYAFSYMKNYQDPNYEYTYNIEIIKNIKIHDDIRKVIITRNNTNLEVLKNNNPENLFISTQSESKNSYINPTCIDANKSKTYNILEDSCVSFYNEFQENSIKEDIEFISEHKHEEINKKIEFNSIESANSSNQYFKFHSLNKLKNAFKRFFFMRFSTWKLKINLIKLSEKLNIKNLKSKKSTTKVIKYIFYKFFGIYFRTWKFNASSIKIFQYKKKKVLSNSFKTLSKNVYRILRNSYNRWATSAELYNSLKSKISNKIINFKNTFNNTLIGNGLQLKHLPLKNSKEPKTCMRLSSDITNLSSEQLIDEDKIPEKYSNSFDIKSEIKKQKSREKSLRRLEKVDRINSAPQSEYIIKSDESSYASPSIYSLNSQDRYDSYEHTSSIFAIKPILIESAAPIEEKIETDLSSSHFQEEESTNIQFLDKKIQDKKEKKIIGDSPEEESFFENETLPEILEEVQKNPAISMDNVEPNINSRQNIEKIEIFSENPNKNCCKCIIF